LRISRPATLSLRAVALLYLALLLLLPLGVVFVRTFEHGIGTAWNWMTTPAAVNAFWLTVKLAAIAVPLNTIFGVGCALVLVRGHGRGRAVLDSLIDLPFVVSPVIVGLALILVYGEQGWFGKWFVQHGIPIIYSWPGMAIATIFVSLPFVVREVAPVLIEIGDEHFIARGFPVEIHHDDLERSFAYPGAPFHAPASPWKVRGRAPHLDEHAERLLGVPDGGAG